MAERHVHVGGETVPTEQAIAEILTDPPAGPVDTQALIHALRNYPILVERAADGSLVFSAI